MHSLIIAVHSSARARDEAAAAGERASVALSRSGLVRGPSPSLRSSAPKSPGRDGKGPGRDRRGGRGGERAAVGGGARHPWRCARLATDGAMTHRKRAEAPRRPVYISRVRESRAATAGRENDPRLAARPTAVSRRGKSGRCHHPPPPTPWVLSSRDPLARPAPR
jgi:hypothetical protein